MKNRFEFKKVDKHLQKARQKLSSANEREIALFEATELWRKGKLMESLKLHLKTLEKYPKDIWNAKKCQLHAFSLGRKDLVLKASTIALRACEGEKDRLGEYVFGMHSFALHENNRNEEAIELIKKRREANDTLDCWAIHAVCHSLYALGRVDEAIGWMERWENAWQSSSNFMFSHNYWHMALLHVEKGQVEKALEIYDEKIVSRDVKTISLLTNAAGLLLRLEVRKIETGGRLEDLVKYLKDKKLWHLDPFFDLFVSYTLSKCGKHRKMASFLSSLEHKIAVMEKLANESCKESGELLNCCNVETWKYVILPFCKGISHYVRGEFQKSFEEIDHVFASSTHEKINASNEQLDVLIELFLDVLLRLSKKDKALQMIDKQISKMHTPLPYLTSLKENLVHDPSLLNLSTQVNECSAK